ncbi:hypothetical protein [Corynebacterium urealyticum]|uniref:hypothetical protein n=1 Tax=Corynebacterium urealyticum TaxID=43771 RepID=UPI00293E3A5C|nr:hypothetical protein [Corynebacterium urealyticum]WOH93897.1 hypothetical protein RZ943_07345 [Corynebacterium urealyticum]
MPTNRARPVRDEDVYRGLRPEVRDKSGRDWYLTQKMLRISDDDAANQLYKKYPEAITKTAQRYGLWSTVAGDKRGTSLTSATDAAVFLDNLRKHTPNSPVLFWMGTAAPVASDGTRQNWGTAQLPGAEGTKWGWSDYGQTAVSSASYGANYTAAAFTWGGPAKQTEDVKSAAHTPGSRLSHLDWFLKKRVLPLKEETDCE